MSHFYEVLNDGQVVPHHDLKESEARKRGFCASVTTKLKLPSNPFLDGWRHKTAVLAAESNCRWPEEDDNAYSERINQMLWGIITRWDGEKFNSNDFGTAVHAELEAWNRNQEYEFAPEWEMYCRSWPDVFAQHCSEVIDAERIVADERLKIAGTVDLIAKDRDDGNVILMDYKTREHKKDGSIKTYEKDCQQLAIEADIIRKQMGLTYMPRCFSVVICTKTGKYGVREWTPYMVNKSLEEALAINLAYNVINRYELLDEAMESLSEYRKQ